MKKILFFLVCSLMLFTCSTQPAASEKSKESISNLSIKLNVMYANDTPCCREEILNNLSVDGISKINWAAHSKIIQINIDSNLIRPDSLVILLNNIFPNKIRFSKLYEQNPTNMPQEDTTIIITTPKTEEELNKEKNQMAV